ncbi:MAG: tetratricopeptide repeat protein [Kofleriaceae bacterium]|nr:tetratricopeptide repeat protein [Kofleriaceae bacterium]
METIRAIAIVVGLCAVASAQPSPRETPPTNPSDEPPAVEDETPAQRAFAEGRKLLEENRPAEACAAFETSIREEPDAPGTLLNLGLCHERLGNIATALQWFRKAQFRAAESHKDEYEAAAKERTAALASKVPTIRVDFANPPPANAMFFVDGSEVTEIEIAKLEVDPGAHTIEMRQDGKTTFREEASLLLGEAHTITIPIAAPVKRFVVVDRGRSIRRLAYVSAGGGVALVLGSAALSLAAKHRYDALEHPEDKQTWKNVARFGGTSMFVVGTAAIAGAAYLLLRAPSAERVEQTAIAPVVGTSELGVAVHGSF